MSSTNRRSPRFESDYYVTPQEEIRKLFSAVKLDCLPLSAPILDPSAGGDDKRPMSYPAVLHDLGVYNITTIDIREVSRAAIIGDYLTFMPTKKYDLIITNPPFTLAQKFIEKALTEITPSGLVIMLLRLNFLGGQLRKSFWHTNPPSFIVVHSKRMSFVPSGMTDSNEYMHCGWRLRNQTDKSCNLYFV